MLLLSVVIMCCVFSNVRLFVSPGSECKVPAGVLTVSLELYPPLTETLSADIISTQVSALKFISLVSSSALLFVNKRRRCELTVNQCNTIPVMM